MMKKKVNKEKGKKVAQMDKGTVRKKQGKGEKKLPFVMKERARDNCDSN